MILDNNYYLKLSLNSISSCLPFDLDVRVTKVTVEFKNALRFHFRVWPTCTVVKFAVTGI